MAARARKTNARGEESPDAELGAEVDEVDPAAVVVLDAVELDPELVLEADEVLEELEPVDVVVELLPLVILVTEEEADDEEELAVVEDETAEELELATPPINWNCGL